MDVSPCVSGLKAGLGAVDGVLLSGAPSLSVWVSLPGWMSATLFLFDHELGYGEASAKEYISGRVALVILRFDGCCNLTRLAQCGACGPLYEIAFSCRVVLLSANTLTPLFESWHDLDLRHQMVRSKLARQCDLQGAGIEDHLCGVVGY